jgi:hypothetical protein
MKVHLNLPSDYNGKTSNRARSDQPIATKTRTKRKEVQRTRNGIALHHFDPVVIQEHGGVPANKISLSFIRDNGLWHNGYTDAYVHDKDKDYCIVVPSYPGESALSDVNQIEQRILLHESVMDTVSSWRGSHTNRSNLAGDKRKLSLDINENLQRAIWFLVKEKEEETNGGNVTLPSDVSDGTSSIEDFLEGKHGAITRVTISRDKYHRNNPTIAKTLFNFEDASKTLPLSSWEVTKGFIDVMFGLQPEELTLESIKQSNYNPSKLSKFEQCLVTLIWFERQYDHSLIVSIFGCNRNIIGCIIRT